MKQLNPHHQASSPKDLPHTLQGSQGASSDNYPEPKTAEAEDDSVFSEEEEKEKPHNDQLVVLPTKSWGPSCIKVKIPEPVFMATQHPEEDQKQGVDDVQKKRLSYCPPSFTWQPVFFLEPLRFSTFEVGPKALTGAGLMVHGIHCEVGPHPKKTPKNKTLGTPKGGPKPKDPPTMGQLLEMFEKNLRRISSLCDFICQKPTLSILDQKSPRATRHLPMHFFHRTTPTRLFKRRLRGAFSPNMKSGRPVLW
ncbi:uncharacterized protein [Notamacropus eugenii]|uniref:uncharacterized protein isoform X2 n=1 Tax=Notamacropus eugenii TaxID=9315 RepID=UPI003B66F5C9